MSADCIFRKKLSQYQICLESFLIYDYVALEWYESFALISIKFLNQHLIHYKMLLFLRL